MRSSGSRYERRGQARQPQVHRLLRASTCDQLVCTRPVGHRPRLVRAAARRDLRERLGLSVAWPEPGAAVRDCTGPTPVHQYPVGVFHRRCRLVEPRRPRRRATGDLGCDTCACWRTSRIAAGWPRSVEGCSAERWHRHVPDSTAWMIMRDALLGDKRLHRPHRRPALARRQRDVLAWSAVEAAPQPLLALAACPWAHRPLVLQNAFDPKAELEQPSIISCSDRVIVECSLTPAPDPCRTHPGCACSTPTSPWSTAACAPGTDASNALRSTPRRCWWGVPSSWARPAWLGGGPGGWSAS